MNRKAAKGAKEKAGRNAHRLIILHLPGRHEGQYLLRRNLTGEEPARNQKST